VIFLKERWCFPISIKVLSADRFVDGATGIDYRIVNSRTEYFTEHTHDYAEMFIMLTGHTCHTANGTRRKLSAGDVVFIRPSDTHKYSKIKDEEFTFCNLTFTKETLESVFSYLGAGFPSENLCKSGQPPTATMTQYERERFEKKIESLGAIAAEDAPKRKTALRILLMELFIALFLDFSHEAHSMPPWLESLCIRMRAEGGFKEGSEQMIALSGRTREHLARSMKKYTGQTVSEFISDLRLNYIANMLKNSNKRISEIVFESGFNTISLATTRFKKKYGVSMRRFREYSGKNRLYI
jgi:AraC family cel operon transcriptional repressor